MLWLFPEPVGLRIQVKREERQGWR
jgi:hypothetical protein